MVENLRQYVSVYTSSSSLQHGSEDEYSSIAVLPTDEIHALQQRFLSTTLAPDSSHLIGRPHQLFHRSPAVHYAAPQRNSDLVQFTETHWVGDPASKPSVSSLKP